MEIGRDGTVSVTMYGESQPQQVGQITLTTFINDAGLESIGENLYMETASSGAPTESAPKLTAQAVCIRAWWKPRTLTWRKSWSI